MHTNILKPTLDVQVSKVSENSRMSEIFFTYLGMCLFVNFKFELKYKLHPLYRENFFIDYRNISNNTIFPPYNTDLIFIVHSTIK